MSSSSPKQVSDHFKGKKALEHVASAHAEGVMTSSEIHGVEAPGWIAAAADALRDCSVTLLLIWEILQKLSLPFTQLFTSLAILCCALIFWKAGRSAWLAWSRLERLHRILAQEKWEIEHHRQQEREELAVLYAAKGFEGKLLEDVLDVLMADGNRLLKVMVQEELCLCLEAYDHPLLQGLGAAIGAVATSIVFLSGCWFNATWGAFAASFLLLSSGTALVTLHIDNKLIPAIVWNGGLLVVAFGSLHSLFDYFLP